MQIRPFGNPDAAMVLIQPVDGRELSGIHHEAEEIRHLSDVDFCLLAAKVERWNHDLSPWAAPAVFGREDFGGGAEAFIQELLPYCGETGKTFIIGGYSLAGLFALWAAGRTGHFSAVAAASPSVWFPGFMGYLKANRIHSRAVYLSLGDQEEKTRNPVMAAVGSCIREVRGTLADEGVACVLEWNPGNHFRDPDLRTARAFAWTLNQLREASLPGVGLP